MMLMFDTRIAKVCGANSAVILQNLYYWVKKNKANGRHFYDGHYWTYNSFSAFEEIFEYMTKSQIRTAIDKLEDCGLIIKGNYNSDPFDKTAWYALTDKAFELLEPETSTSEKSHACERDISPRCDENHTWINNNIYIHSDPDNKQTDINTDINSKTVSDDTVRRTDVQRVMEAWNHLSECGIAPVSKISPGSKRYKSLQARVREYGVDTVLEAIEKIRGSSFLQGRSGGKRQWMITFDWFVLPSNFPKVLEGNYSDRNVKGPDNAPPEPCEDDEPLVGDDW